MNETEAMRRALDLAWRGWGRVHPNPMVGAVVLRSGIVIGEGYHAEFGGPHAEAAAIAAAGRFARGCTLVVTLEPCDHLGQQPPCTGLIQEAGIDRVIVATRDPNPVAAGGAAHLAELGVRCELGLLTESAQAQNAIFLHRFLQPERPFVALKLATTIDNRIADRAGRSRWISGEESRDFVHWLRAGFDAIGVGGHTARVDDASLTVRGAVVPRTPPLRVVFDRHAECPLSLNLIRTAAETPTTMVVGSAAPTARITALDGAGVKVIRALSLVAGLRSLREQGVESILIEGGGRLAGALLEAGLVDRYYWIQSPLWLGESGIPAISGLPGAGLVEAERWQVVERRPLGEDTLLVMDRRACSPAS